MDIDYNFCNINNQHILKTQLPGNLDEILPLKFRLREAMRFFRMGTLIVAEKVRTKQRYSLRPWQYDLILAFDGKMTFEEAAKAVYRTRPKDFTAIGLLNFYNWLYSEKLVLCECESIFELVIDDVLATDAERTESRASGFPSIAGAAGWLVRDTRGRRVLAACATLVLSLSVIRLAQVVSPVFDPPARRLYVEVRGAFDPPSPAVSATSSERAVPEIMVERIALAARAAEPSEASARVEGPPAGREVEESLWRNEEPAPVNSAPLDVDAAAHLSNRFVPEVPASKGLGEKTLSRVESLRAELEECRIRRDEFHLQNDEDGYRREAHRMTSLAREIGNIENSW